jgi:hypothetical protein
MNETQAREKPTGAFITDRLLTEEEWAEVSRVVREYDGSIPLTEYLQAKCPSLHIEWVKVKP